MTASVVSAGGDVVGSRPLGTMTAGSPLVLVVAVNNNIPAGAYSVVVSNRNTGTLCVPSQTANPPNGIVQVTSGTLPNRGQCTFTLNPITVPVGGSVSVYIHGDSSSIGHQFQAGIYGTDGKLVSNSPRGTLEQNPSGILVLQVSLLTATPAGTYTVYVVDGTGDHSCPASQAGSITVIPG
jgi:hypothetical protein